MATLTERTEEDKIEILSDGTIQVRTATIIERGGVEVSRSWHRHVVAPDDDVTTQSDFVKGYANVARTPTRVASHKAKKAAENANAV